MHIQYEKYKTPKWKWSKITKNLFFYKRNHSYNQNLIQDENESAIELSPRRDEWEERET